MVRLGEFCGGWFRADLLIWDTAERKSLGAARAEQSGLEHCSSRCGFLS